MFKTQHIVGSSTGNVCMNSAQEGKPMNTKTAEGGQYYSPMNKQTAEGGQYYSFRVPRR